MQYIDEWRNISDEISNLKKKISDARTRSRKTPYYWTRQWVLNNKPNLLSSYDDSLSLGQYESKKWLVQELKKIKIKWIGPIHIDIIGGWFGYPLIELLQSVIDIKQIDFYEIDNDCKEILTQHINNFNPSFKICIFNDFFERKDLRRRQLVINTSSEHMKDIVLMKKYYKDYPTTPIIAIQSNNYNIIDDHINCVNSVEELIEKNQISNILYKGENNQELYTRYMAIGQW